MAFPVELLTPDLGSTGCAIRDGGGGVEQKEEVGGCEDTEQRHET